MSCQHGSVHLIEHTVCISYIALTAFRLIIMHYVVSRKLGTYFLPVGQTKSFPQPPFGRYGRYA